MAGFIVKQVIERPAIDDSGQLKQNTVIYLETVRGGRGTVELPTQEYMGLASTPDGKDIIGQLLQEKANALDAPFEM